MKSNCIDLNPSMKNVKEFNKQSHGELDWIIHSSKRLYSMVWKNKQFVLLLSTYALPITEGDSRSCYVSKEIE